MTYQAHDEPKGDTMTKRTKRGGLVGQVYGVEFHRNGISGAWFYVVTFAPGARMGEGSDAVFMATVFEARGHVAVLRLVGGRDDADRAIEAHFRGDDFEPELRAILAKHNADGERGAQGRRLRPGPS